MERITVDDFEPKKRSYKERTAGKGKPGNRAYEDKPFIAWDGEGWTEHICGEDGPNCPGGCPHHYYLFGASTGDSISNDSLRTLECFDLMLDCARENSDAIHVAFAFTYDVNMICRDIPHGAMRRLVKFNSLTWRGYRIEWIPKKWFQVSSGGVTCRIQDIFTFYGMSFVKALKQWEVGTDEEIRAISDGKDQRGDFQLSMLDTLVRPYWEMELRLLVGLADKLRTVLYSGGIRISQWFGPGVIASQLYKDKGTASLMARELPEEVIHASCRAYAGGRFEGYRAGFYEGTIYSADINSAYPYALSLMPSLATGRWGRTNDPVYLSGHRLSLTHVRYTVNKRSSRVPGFPYPTFYRDQHHSIKFPRCNNVWVHRPELEQLLRLAELPDYFESFEILDGWVFEDDGTFPFEWVGDLYQQRAEWKRQGNPAQLAAKLGLNSLYGKLAQRIGGRDGNIPRWHQLEWAGAITSHCRAMLFEGSNKHGEGLIAHETDGAYSTVPYVRLPGGEGNGLGQWKVERYSGMVYLQSGVYWLRTEDGIWLPPKSRGIPTKQLDLQSGLRALRSKDVLHAKSNQFIGFSLADMRHGRGWRTWERTTKQFVFGGGGKRAHDPERCSACSNGIGWDSGLHNLQPKPSSRSDPESVEHPLPWRNVDTDFNELQRELLRGDIEYGDEE